MGSAIKYEDVPKRTGARDFREETQAIYDDIAPDVSFVRTMKEDDGYEIADVCQIVMDSEKKCLTKIRRMVVTVLERLEIDPDLYTVRVRGTGVPATIDGKEQIELKNWSAYIHLRRSVVNAKDEANEAPVADEAGFEYETQAATA